MPKTDNNASNQCRVCGFEYVDFFPWGLDGKTPSFEICDCCGIEFGYEDATLEAIKQARALWIEKGAPWAQPQLRPTTWTLESALAKIPSEYQ